MQQFRHLTLRYRIPWENQIPGLLLALNAGTVNAGGFLVLQRYRSHISDFASQAADALVLTDVDYIHVWGCNHYDPCELFSQNPYWEHLRVAIVAGGNAAFPV